jgi:hypothetical protein
VRRPVFGLLFDWIKTKLLEVDPAY